MSAAERYIRRATRGLAGQTKQDAQAELRGAIEDKIYRYTLLGLAPAEAEQAALRDLGSPAAVAGGLSRVHVGTAALRTALMVGVAGVLGIQAVAQVRTVASTYLLPDTTSLCRLANEAEMRLMSAANRARYQAMVSTPGGAETFLQNCRVKVLSTNVLLSVPDLLDALRGAGVTLKKGAVTPAGYLTIYGGPKGDIPQVSYSTYNLPDGPHVSSLMVVPFIKGTTDARLRLEGLTNPTLHVGDMTLRLGSAAAPVQTTDLLAGALEHQRRTDTSLPLPVTIRAVLQSVTLGTDTPKLILKGKEGAPYVVLQNPPSLMFDGGELISVRALTGGRLDYTDEAGVRPRIVNSLAELDAATAHKQKAILVYKLDATDLRNLKLTPVPAAQVRVVQP